MDKEKKVSIILVNYNGAKDTIECIESIDKSSYLSRDIIVVDNCSSDDSLGILSEKYGNRDDVIILKSMSNDGFSSGNNIGIDYALNHDAEYIFLLNNDTIIEPETIETLVNQSLMKRDAAILTSKIMYYYDKNRIWYAGGQYSFTKGTAYHIGVNEVDRGQYDVEQRINFCCGCLLFMSRFVANKIGYLPTEYFLYGEDVAYSLIAINAGVSIVYIPDTKIYHKVSVSTGKNSNLSQYYIIRNRLMVIKKYHRGISRFTASVYSILWCIKRIIKKEFLFNNAMTALNDYNSGKIGKKEDGNGY